jgi:hypothetical protein
MALETLPDSLLDFVVELAGWDHGWRLEIVSPALRAASAVCVARRLGTCRWDGGPGAATFQPRWRHCAAAKRCGPCYLKPGDYGADKEYVNFPAPLKTALDSCFAVFETRYEAEKFVVERVPGSTDGRILSLQQRDSGAAILSIDPPGAQDNGLLCLVEQEHPVLLASGYQRSQHFRTQWLLQCERRTSYLEFRLAMNTLHCPDEPRRGGKLYVSEAMGVSRYLRRIRTFPYWMLVSAALPENEMYFVFEHRQL